MTVELGKVYSCNVELRMLYFYFIVDILQKLHSKILTERNTLGVYVKIQGRLFCIDNGKETSAEGNIISNFSSVYDCFEIFFIKECRYVCQSNADNFSVFYLSLCTD